MNRNTRVASWITALMLSGGVAVVFVGSADAVSGSCTSSRQEREIWGPNSFRVRAKCSSLGSDSKARGVLDIASEPDMQTGWFTDLNTYHYSSYYRCTFSCSNTRVDIARR